MERATVIERIVKEIACVHCGERLFNVTHLLSRNEDEYETGTWYCDKCGKSFFCKGNDGILYVEKRPDTKQETTVLMKYHNLLLYVNGAIYNGVIDKGEQRYYYEEHTCPENILTRVDKVVDISNGAREDPHGIFEYIDTFIKTNEE